MLAELARGQLRKKIPALVRRVQDEHALIVGQILAHNDPSAGKRRAGKTGKGNKWLRATLNESANAAARTK
ncbi:MAG TPA: hypothetical protein VLW51_06700, partial [Solirubrobacteraceae bacterium]|nr:hypothetical protein [Solirubrobacteraceae bacterium]